MNKLFALGFLVLLNAASLSPSLAASGGIVLDAATHSGDGRNISSISWSHSVSSGISNAVLIVGAVSRDSVDADRVVTRVTYGGISLNPVRQDDEPVNNVHASLWYLTNPPTGAHTVVIDYASPVDVAFGTAASFGGVDQSAPVNAQAGLAQSGGMTATQSISLAAGGWAVDVQYAGADMGVTQTSGQTPVVHQAVAVGRTNDIALMTVKGPMSQAGVASMGYSYSESSQVALSIVSLKPVATAPTNPVPSITNVNPSSGTIGTTVTISGTDFGASQGTSTVHFNGTNATPTSWNSTQIVAPVPNGATTGNVQVTVAGVSSNGYPFTVLSPTTQSLGFVQANSAVPQTPQSAVSVRFSLPQTAGDLNVIAIGWADALARIQSVVDSRGNVYRVAVGPTVQTGVATHAIYYAANIVSAAANANVVTVTFSAPAHYPDIRIAEYRGVDPVNPIDVTSAAMGSGSMSDSGTVQTTNANDLLVGANKVRSVTTGPGTGYTSRVLTSPNGDILEDRVITSTGSYSATAPVSPGSYWIMQLVAFRAGSGPPPGPDTVPPSVPTGVSAQAQSATQINLSWTASSDNVGVSGYVVYRGGVQIGDTPATTYTDSNLNPGTTYSYSVTAYDPALNFSAQSAAVSATTPTTTPTPGGYPIKVSSNGRYLVDQNNVPFLVAGDSARSLIANISLSDADTYFSARQAEGFNTVWINLLCNDGTGCRPDGSTYDGIPPFTTPQNLLTPNEAFFARVDQVLNLAAAHGITVMLDPAETIGWLSVLRTNGANNSRAYGRYLGNRYRNFNNIVWAHGNDFQNWQIPQDDAVVQAVALGILDNDNRHIHTIQLNYYTSGSYDDSSWIPILGIDSVYTYYPTYAQVLKEYNRSSVPVVLVEANYEFENNTGNPGTPGLLRRQEYWTLLSGGAGQLYGSYYTNHFKSGWQTHLQTPGATQMVNLKSLFEARRWFDLVPDQNHSVIVAGYGTYIDTSGSFGNNDYVTAARTTDGSLVMAYVPQLRTITVDMTRLAGSVTARWYDPANGSFLSVGSSIPNTGLRSFTSPGNNSDGDVDWILVLEVVP